MNKERIEEFLARLPQDSISKIEKLKYSNNLVLINRRHGFLEEVETGKIIKKANWDFTIPEIAKKLHVSRTWVYINLQSNVRYIYINNFDIESLSIFYEKSIGELRQYRELTPIHLNTEDVVRWFNTSFIHGKRSIVINSQRIFGTDNDQILLTYALNSINHFRFDIHVLDKYVIDAKLWNLCLNAPVFHHTSKYPIVKIPKTITAQDLKSTTFHSLNEYKYAANGMRDLITSGSDVYKGCNGKNSKMLFTFSDNDPFDINWMYQEISKRLKNTPYSPKVIDDTVTALTDMFVVPAAKYFKELPIL